jgi:PTS system galactitol-specific IIC component
MDGVLSVIQWFLDLGAAVFLPIIIFILGLVVRLKPVRAFRAALLFGVAFTGMLLVIVSLFYADIAPAASAMVDRFGLSLNTLDIGWTPAAAIAWAWPLAATMFGVQIAINLIMLAFNWTKCLNVDMWNVWVKAFGGALIVAMTDNYVLAYAIASIWIIVELKMGDWISYQTHEYINVPGITVPHSAALALAIAAPVDWLFTRIPGLDKIKTDPQGLRDRFGVFGEPMILGLIIGLLLGILAGYTFQQTLTLGVKAATALVVLPMMARLFMEGLAPISEAAGEFMKQRFPGREVFIGLDWPILAGNPATYAVGILCIPLMLLFVMVLPGNETLIFGSIADWAWMVSVVGVIVGGDIVRMILVSLILIPSYLYAATYFGPAITQVAASVGSEIPEGASTITWFGTTPFFWMLAKIGELNAMSIVWLLATVGLLYATWKILTKREVEAKERLGL